MINIWFKFEDKIQNTSKVIVFTRNETDDDHDDGADDEDDDGTKNNMSPPGRGGGGRHNIREIPKLQYVINFLIFEKPEACSTSL